MYDSFLIDNSIKKNGNFTIPKGPILGREKNNEFGVFRKVIDCVYY